MNEKIKEIALQAGGSFYPDVNSMQLEKFAELIIKECCDMLSKELIIHDGYGYNQTKLHRRLKEHFGVEE